MPIRFRKSLIMGQILSKHPELFALEFGKTAESDFFCSLVSTNINQSAPNFVTMCTSIRSQMSLIIGQVIPDQVYLQLGVMLQFFSHKCR